MQNQHHYIFANTSIPAYRTPDIDFLMMSLNTKKAEKLSRLTENNDKVTNARRDCGLNLCPKIIKLQKI